MEFISEIWDSRCDHEKTYRVDWQKFSNVSEAKVASYTIPAH